MPESKTISLWFKGCGPTIYMMDFMAWREVFMDEEEGDAVYAMVLGMRGKEGAVPTGMEIRHGNTKEELNGFGKEAAERGLVERVLMGRVLMGTRLKRWKCWTDAERRQQNSALIWRDLKEREGVLREGVLMARVERKDGNIGIGKTFDGILM
jgi:hypothetical protein